MKVGYDVIHLFDIAPVAATIGIEKGYEIPTVVVIRIGRMTELNFCFGGISIVKRNVEKISDNRLNEFIEDSKAIQLKDFSDVTNFKVFRKDDGIRMNKIWKEKQKIRTILVMNELLEGDYEDINIEYDSKVNFDSIFECFDNAVYK